MASTVFCSSKRGEHLRHQLEHDGAILDHAAQFGDGAGERAAMIASSA
jgi:hypothetical protein